MKKEMLIGLTALLMNCNFNATTPKYDTTPAKVQLAQCLVEKGAVMYGAEWCGYCNKEKKEFGEAAWKVMQQNYIECTEEANESKCSEVAVGNRISFPSWKLPNGKIIRGYTPNFLEVLAKESGCNN